jgi:outer membrane lipoprotein-sorting protein
MQFTLIKKLTATCGLLFITSLVFALNAEDWKLEDILVKVEDANGGIDSIKAVSDLRMRGSIKSTDVTYDFLLLKKRPNKLRIHLMYKGRSVETGFDGIEGWQRVWIGGEDTVRTLSKDELAAANLETDFDGPLIGTAPPLMTRTFVGVERVDRTDYFLIKVEEPKSRTIHYIDSRTFREWKTEREVLDAEGEVTDVVVNFFTEYRKHKSIWIAEHLTRVNQAGETEEIFIEEVEIDPGILDRAFVKPKQWSVSP